MSSEISKPKGAKSGSKALAERKTSPAFDRGLAVRKAVLGADHVERSLDGANDDFNWPLQEFVTEVGWGWAWSRPGLTRQERSLINLAMLTALNRPHELEVHLKGALNNGCTPEQIREVLLQTAVYCGAPAAIDSFRVAKRVMAQMAEPKDA